MSNITLPAVLRNRRYKRAAHGAAALAIAFLMLLALLTIGGVLLQPLLTTHAALKERAQNADALSMRLARQQAALAKKLHRINAPTAADIDVLTAPQIAALLESDADAFVAMMESRGLVLSSRSPTMENKISPALSAYAVALRFSASSEAAIAAIVNHIDIETHVVRMNMSNAPGNAALTLDIDLQRIGASAETDGRTNG